MTVEKRGNYSESRASGIGMIPSLLGKRCWVELPSGAYTSDGSMTVVDEDTIQVRKNIWRGSHTAWPIDSFETYQGAAINELPGFRWVGDASKVIASVKKSSSAYIPKNFDQELARRDRTYARKHPIDPWR